jgi:hypothetical protein
MAVTTEPATFENQSEVVRTPATPETTRPVEARPDLARLLAQAYVSTPLFG